MIPYKMEIIFTIVLLLFYGAAIAYLMWKIFCIEPIYLNNNGAFPNVSTKYFYQVSFDWLSLIGWERHLTRTNLKNGLRVITKNFRDIRKMVENELEKIWNDICSNEKKLTISKIKELKNKICLWTWAIFGSERQNYFKPSGL